MFLFAKLIGLGGTLLSAGVAISFLVPYFRNKDQNLISSLIYEENNSNNRFDLSALNQRAKRNIRALEKQIQKLSSAKEIASNWKNSAHKNISTNLDELSKKEKQLTNLYKEIYDHLKQLITKQAEIFQLSLQRLEINREKSLNSFFNSSYSQLNAFLDDWESRIKEVKCEIDNCNKTWANVLDWIKSVVPLVSYLESFFESKEKSTSSLDQSSNNTGLKGSEKTKKELSGISSELSKLLSEIKKKNGIYKDLQIRSKINKLLLANKLSALEELIEKLNKEKDNLDKIIKSLIDRVTQLINTINNINNQLSELINSFTYLKSWEASLHNWNTKLKESLFHYQSDLKRELKLRH